MSRTKTGIRLPKLPKALPAERGKAGKASYDESRKFLWSRLCAGDRGFANALYYWGNGPKPKGVIDIPYVIDDVAIRAAARWVRQNMPKVREMIAKAAGAAKPTTDQVDAWRAEVRRSMSFYRS